jgi:DNA gyrase subunit A
MAIRFSESNVRAMGRTARGVKGIKLGEGDQIVGMLVADADGQLLTVTENGYGKRTPFGPNSPEAGEAGGDSEDSALEESHATRDAEGPPSDVGEESGLESDPTSMRYRIQRRGGKGLKDVKVTSKNGPVVGIANVRDGDEIMLITKDGMVTRSKVDGIRIVGRNTQGVRVMNLNEGDRLVTVAKVASETVGE